MARGSKNVLDCRLSGIKLVAAFLYCGYRNQTKSSPDKMSMTSPPQTKPRLSTILSAGHFFLSNANMFVLVSPFSRSSTDTDGSAVVLESWGGFTFYVPHLYSIS